MFMFLQITKLEQTLKDEQEKFHKEKDQLQHQLHIADEKAKKQKMELDTLIKVAQDKDTAIAKLSHDATNTDAATKNKDNELAKLTEKYNRQNQDMDNILKKLVTLEQDRAKHMKDAEDSVLRAQGMAQNVNTTNQKMKELTTQRDKLQKDLNDLLAKCKSEEPIMEKGKKYDALQELYEQEKAKVQKSFTDIANSQNQAQEAKKQMENMQGMHFYYSFL